MKLNEDKIRRIVERIIKEMKDEIEDLIEDVIKHDDSIKNVKDMRDIVYDSIKDKVNDEMESDAEDSGSEIDDETCDMLSRITEIVFEDNRRMIDDWIDTFYNDRREMP